MNISTNYGSALKLIKLMVVDSSFHCDEDCPEDINLQLSINKQIERLTNENIYRVVLNSILADADKKMSISVKTIGTFLVENIEDSVLIEKNAIAIMFPFIRSYFTSITTQPNMMPIVLPPINVNAMFS